MYVFTKVVEVAKVLDGWIGEGLRIGFVPTMGALHVGHVSLLAKSLAENDRSIVSVFVNPNQFNNAADLEKYPRTFEHDKLMLENAGADIMFFPSVSEIYPSEDTRKFDFGELEVVMEGMHRPGHFNGVAQVVSRLFDIVKPTRAYFGEKDFQQLAIINAMVRQLNINVEIVGCPILREEGGLAMSSRNERLSQEDRLRARLLFEVLKEAKVALDTKPIQQVKLEAIQRINSSSFFKLEYFEISDSESLQPASYISLGKHYVICVAAWIGGVRLIDNIRV